MPADDRREAEDPAANEEGEEWRYPLSDLEEEPDDSGEGVFGSFSDDEAIEPQEIDLENVLFVVLGVVVAIVGVYLMLP